MKFPRLVLVALLALAMSGCATTRLYEGPPKPASEVVEITGMSGLDPLGGFTSSLICAVDDKKIEGCATHVEILPGFHEITTVAKSYGIEELSYTFKREFKPGEKYLLGITMQGAMKAPALMRAR